MNKIQFNPKEFLIELCKYYMEFLETDFKGKRPPSRKIFFSQKEGILTDIDLAKYPKLNQRALALLASNFQNDPFSNLTREDFAVKFPEAIIREIKNPDLSSPEKLIATFLKERRLPNRAIVLKEVQSTIREKGVGDLASYLSQYIILSFYDELYELWKNKQVLDKQDFYLYFLDIRYEDNIYPLFYIPVSIDRTKDGGFSFDFDPVFLINKRAIQYVSEKYAEQQGKAWRIDLPPRHLYLSNFEERGKLLTYLQEILGEVCDFFSLQRFNINSPEVVEVKNDKVNITNNCYLSLFDKSDEALLNDYEELLTIALSGKEGKALEILSKLSTDYLFENPMTFEREVETEYEAQSLSEKIAYVSPIPLNKEQLEVLKALDKKDCNLIVIEGPPGTGKSHTITAIIYNALLDGKSVLMVSDKKEALDVVEDKITQVLDKMRLDDFLQNPILRLGKKDTNYNNIFRQINYDKIKSRFSNYQRNKERVEKEISTIRSAIEKNINDEIAANLSLNPQVTNRLLSYEEKGTLLWQDLVDFDELEDLEGSAELLLELWMAVRQFNKIYTDLIQNYKVSFPAKASSLRELKVTTLALQKDLEAVCKKIAEEYPSLCLSKEMTGENLLFLQDCLKELETLKKPLIGYFLCGKRIKLIESQFRERFFLAGLNSIVGNRDELSRELQLYQYCQKLNESWASIGLDLFLILRANSQEDVSKGIHRLAESINGILRISGKLPITCTKLGINISDISTMFSNSLLKFQEDDIKDLGEYLDDLSSVLEGCTRLTPGSFMENRRILENRLVLKMTNILDESVVSFRENNKNDAEALRKIIKAKKKIPKDLLRTLIQAFPCLIVGIRELGEFIPLEPNIFDIVVIDEASQVSIAQAFPAILRGKKVVVLGDKQQYTNVKSHNAAIAVNNFLFNRVKDAFEKSISVLNESEQDKVKDRVVNFNIKNSILDFLGNITNYQCSLKKHFRGYIEIIDFSNVNFYQHSLQVMKIRGKSIKEIIQFYYVETDDIQEKYRNTNQAEVDFILKELERLKNDGYRGTIGIITPFTNQQKLISNCVYDSENWQFYQNEFKLKIMTFDSCQGDERDIIYYSIVEKSNEDILKFIFPIKLSNLEDEEDGNLKAQRLNVGFSRAKESIRFVMSKRPEDFRGAIGKALLFYKGNLDKPDDLEKFKEMDPKSQMEPVLFNFITQTPFYKENRDRIEIIPQFPIGRYIKQLNPLATIPKYRSDFLLIYRDDTGRTKMFILEYDGFEHHFKDTGFVNEANFDRFYVEEDIERTKTIESYGYDFIRVNKFLLREDPITFLNDKLERCCKKKE